LDARTVEVDLQVTVTSGSTEAAVASIAAGFQNQQVTDGLLETVGQFCLAQLYSPLAAETVSALQVQLPGRPVPLLVFGRPVAVQTSIDTEYQFGRVNSAVQFVCQDGAIYDNSPQVATCGLPSPTAGLTFPVTFPATFGATSGGSLTLSNLGLYPTWPAFRINGPCQTPTITNSATGQFLTVGITLGSTDFLLIDMQAGLVTLNGTLALRNNLIATGSAFFTLLPGAASIGFGTRDATTVAATLQAACLAAYSAV
jgi:hypothetical protein